MAGHLAHPGVVVDGELVKITSENSKLQGQNEDLEKEVTILEAKLSDKTRALEKLEKVQDELEIKMSKISSHEVLDKYATEKTNDLLLEIEELKKDNRLLKVEVRLSKFERYFLFIISFSEHNVFHSF